MDVSGECLAVACILLEENGVLGNQIKSANEAHSVDWRGFRIVPSNRQGGFVHVFLSERHSVSEHMSFRN